MQKCSPFCTSQTAQHTAFLSPTPTLLFRHLISRRRYSAAFPSETHKLVVANSSRLSRGLSCGTSGFYSKPLPLHYCLTFSISCQLFVSNESLCQRRAISFTCLQESGWLELLSLRVVECSQIPGWKCC